MSLFERLSDRQITIYAVAGVAVLAAAALWFAGSGNQASDHPSISADDAKLAQSSLDDALKTLSRNTDLGSCQSALTQFNLYRDRSPEQIPTAMDDAQQLALQKLLDLDEEELAEVTSAIFTPLDAHHMDMCSLLHDAASALDLPGLPPLEQARAAFGWVVRQVRLDSQDREPAPVEYVLRRGSGTALERALVFIALLGQMNLDGCLIDCPLKAGDSAVDDRFAGVRVGRDIYIFDPVLGLPLPGPDGKGVATLTQLRTIPRVVEQLTVDPKTPYDVAPAQARQATVRLACSLSALAPRMKYLEQMLTGCNGVHLATDLIQQQKEFQKAAGPGVTVAVREARSSASPSLARLQRRFLPPAEGGVDKTGREEMFRRRLFPLGLLPQLFAELPDSFPPRNVLYDQFAELFEDFPIDARAVAQEVAKEIQQQLGPSGAQEARALQGEDVLSDLDQRMALLYLSGTSLKMHGGHRLVHFTLAPQSLRDDMLRGRLEQASNRLGEALDQVDYQRRQAKDIDQLQKDALSWREQMMEAYARLNRIKDAVAHGRAPNDPHALQNAEAGVLSAWPIVPPAQLLHMTAPKPPWLVILLRAAADPLGEQARYFLALCTQEQAEQRQIQVDHMHGKVSATESAAAREAWSSAADRWKTYLINYPSSAAAPTARAHEARALSMLGNRAEAAALLTDMSGVAPSERAGRLYLAKRLESK